MQGSWNSPSCVKYWKGSILHIDPIFGAIAFYCILNAYGKIPSNPATIRVKWEVTLLVCSPKPIASKQMVQDQLVDMANEIVKANLMNLYFSRLQDNGD